MPCEVRVAERRHSGFVLDLSPSGLFIQTSAKAEPGEQLDVTLSLPSGEEASLGVAVARKKVVPARLLTVAQGGIGVRITRAPEAYFAFVQELGLEGAPRPAGARGRGAGAAGGSEEEEAVAAPDVPRFRVRVSQVSGPRSRRVEVTAADAEAAAAAALESLGEGWKVLDVEPLG